MKLLFALVGPMALLGEAIKPPLARPTDPQLEGILLQGFSPMPTEAPRWPLELVRRVSAASASSNDSFLGWVAPDNTCGYVRGSIGAIKTCDSTQRCGALEFEGVGTMACCDTADAACTFLGTCVNSIGYYSSSLCDHACQQDINTVKCTEASLPYCYGYMIPGISVGWYSCDSTFTSGFDVFETTFLGETDQRTWKSLYDTSSGPISSNLSPFTGTLTTTSGPPSTNSITPSGSGKSKSNAGAIAGGVVGGLAVLAAAGLGFFFLLSRRRRGQSQAGTGATAAEYTTPGGGPAPDMAQKPPAGQSMYGAPAHYDPNADPNRVSMAGGYFADKQDHIQQHHNSTNLSASSKYGPHDSIQAVPGSPQPSSPAPPYAPQPNLVPGPVGSPPPQHVSELPTGMPPAQGPPQPSYVEAPAGGQMPGQPQQPQQPYAAYQPPAELGTHYAIPTHTTQGAPMFEAPTEGGHYQQPPHQ